MWLSAKPPSIPTNNFPYRIEELSPSIWHTLYKKESNIFHAPTKSCLLCSKIDKIINKITKCHKSALSPDCTNCQEKHNNANYLNREWLARIHTKNLSSLVHTKIGGEVKPLRAEAWNNEKNNNKANEPLKTQMERELSKFSRSRKPIPLQAWVPDKGQPNANKKSIQPTQANLQNKRDTEREQKTVPLIPDEKPSAEDNNLVTIGETETTNITSTQLNSDNKEDSNVMNDKVQQTPAVEILAAVKESPEETNPLTETQLQFEGTESPPISFGENSKDLAWIDAEEEAWIDAEDDPWEYGMQLGCSYNV